MNLDGAMLWATVVDWIKMGKGKIELRTSVNLCLLSADAVCYTPTTTLSLPHDPFHQTTGQKATNQPKQTNKASSLKLLIVRNLVTVTKITNLGNW